MNGPLLSIVRLKKKRPKKLTRREREAAAASNGPPEPVAVAAFVGDVTPWWPDETATRTPERGEMENKIAVVAGTFQSGRVTITSTHPEFEASSGDTVLPSILEKMCLWAAGHA